MKKLYFVANWKSNMHIADAVKWLDHIAGEKHKIIGEDKVVIVCPPFTILQALKYKIDTFGSLIGVGAQNVSPYEEGAHTGEIAAAQLKEFCSYVLIGHSERRNDFSETDAQIAEKVKHSLAAGLIPIFCVQDENTQIPEGVTMVAYEPVAAIGTGNPDSPDNASVVCKKIRDKHTGVQTVLYGGSVAPDNVHSFTDKESIDGVLVGSGSLDAANFINIIQNA
jgi:triosephosphate isomerase